MYIVHGYLYYVRVIYLYRVIMCIHNTIYTVDEGTSSGAGVDRPISQVNVCSVYSDVVVVVVVFVPIHIMYNNILHYEHYNNIISLCRCDAR